MGSRPIALIFTFLFALSIIWAEQIVKKTDLKSVQYSPLKQEGYIQGWNFYFKDNDYYIQATLAITNMGPGSLNSGVAVSVHKKGSLETEFYSDDFRYKSLVIDKKKFFIKLGKNSIQESNGVWLAKFNIPKGIKINLKLSPTSQLISLSGGEYPIGIRDYFVRADVIASFVPAEIELIKGKEKQVLKGIGGIEHLKTNYEVYKFSNMWDIHRANSNSGYQVFTGGFYTSKSGVIPLKTITVLDPKGNLVLGEKVTSIETVATEKDSFSGYMIPIEEIYYWNDNKSCFMRLKKKGNLGKVNIIQKVTFIIRMIIKAFFTNPYQIAYSTEVEVDCPEKLKQKISAFGTETLYLINKD